MEPVNLESYRRGTGGSAAGKYPAVKFGYAALALERLNAIAAFVPRLKPKDVYANPNGGTLHFRSYKDLVAAGAKEEDDTFMLGIQFVNVRHGVPMNTEDPVENYGPVFPLASVFGMLQTGDPEQFLKFVMGTHAWDKTTAGQGGEGTPEPLPAGTQELMQLLAAPAIAAEIALLMNDGLPELPKAKTGGFSDPDPQAAKHHGEQIEV